MIAYFSKTGNIERFINKLSLDNTLKIEEENTTISEKFILVSYTTGLGEVPDAVETFVKKNKKNIVGFIGSGNRNFGSNFAKAVDILSSKYDIPVLMKFELSGNSHNVASFKEIYHKFIKEKI